jgi:hypothetical protein
MYVYNFVRIHGTNNPGSSDICKCVYAYTHTHKDTHTHTHMMITTQRSNIQIKNHSDVFQKEIVFLFILSFKIIFSKIINFKLYIVVDNATQNQRWFSVSAEM